jgi:hypothetical protein
MLVAPQPYLIAYVVRTNMFLECPPAPEQAAMPCSVPIHPTLIVPWHDHPMARMDPARPLGLIPAGSTPCASAATPACPKSPCWTRRDQTLRPFSAIRHHGGGLAWVHVLHLATVLSAAYPVMFGGRHRMLPTLPVRRSCKVRARLAAE